jgi:CRP-like cAMP-binding protein
MILPTDQLYRDQLMLIYQNPHQISPRILIALALIESEEPQGYQLLNRCLEVSFYEGYPTLSLWVLSLLKKYKPLQSYQEWYQRLSQYYSKTLEAPKTQSISYEELLTSNSALLDDQEKTAEQATLNQLNGHELQAQATAIAFDFSCFGLADNPSEAQDPKLGDLPLFSAFNHLQLKQLLNTLTLCEFKEGDFLIEEGEEADGFFLICYGDVHISRRSQEGETIDIATLSSGKLVGEMGLVTQSPRVATATATDQVWALKLPTSAYEIIQECKDEIHQALSHLVGGRMLQNLTTFSPIFRVIPTSAHPKLLAEFQSIIVERGQVLLTQGQPGKGLFLILDGLIKVSQLGSIHPKWLREGDVFGEISLVYDSPVSATCTAARRSLLFTLTPQRFQGLMTDYPEIQNTLKELSLFRNLDALYTLT